MLESLAAFLDGELFFLLFLLLLLYYPFTYNFDGTLSLFSSSLSAELIFDDDDELLDEDLLELLSSEVIELI